MYPIPTFTKSSTTSFIIFFKRGLAYLFNSGKEHPRASKILGHVGFLSSSNWSFVERSALHLLWPILYSEETLRSLLKPLLTCCDLYYRKKQLSRVTLEATVEEGNPASGLKNVMLLWASKTSQDYIDVGFKHSHFQLQKFIPNPEEPQK
jgi:hypothetical protein